MKFKYRWWGKGDVDASIGIFFDGFSKILSATGIMLFVFGMPADIVLGKIVPGVGLAIFAGNLWYFYEAWSLAKKEHRQDVTAQPFGIGASQLTAGCTLLWALSIGRPATRNWLSKWGWRPPSSAASSRCWGASSAGGSSRWCPTAP